MDGATHDLISFFIPNGQFSRYSLLSNSKLRDSQPCWWEKWKVSWGQSEMRINLAGGSCRLPRPAGGSTWHEECRHGPPSRGTPPALFTQVTLLQQILPKHACSLPTPLGILSLCNLVICCLLKVLVNFLGGKISKADSGYYLGSPESGPGCPPSPVGPLLTSLKSLTVWPPAGHHREQGGKTAHASQPSRQSAWNWPDLSPVPLLTPINLERPDICRGEILQR